MIETWANGILGYGNFCGFLESKMVNLGQLISNLVCPFISMQILGKTNLKSISQKMWLKWLIFDPR